MWKNLEQIRRQVEEGAQVVRAQVAQGAKEFAQTAIEGVRDLKAQHDDEGEDHGHTDGNEDDGRRSAECRSLDETNLVYRYRA